MNDKYSLALLCLPLVTLAGLSAFAKPSSQTKPRPVASKPVPIRAGFERDVAPLVQKYCLSCHSTKAKKGSLDLERFATLDDIRGDVKVWQGIIEQIEAGEMPPKDKPQPTAAEKTQLLAWVRTFLDTEAKARSGDPGMLRGSSSGASRLTRTVAVAGLTATA